MTTSYNTVKVTAKGNIFSVTQAKGKHNYISVLKETNNPFKTLGKQFSDFDAAQQNYKCADLKVALLLAQSQLAEIN